MRKALAVFCACVSFAACADSIKIQNLKIEQIDSGTKIKVSWRINDPQLGWLIYYSVALTRGETPDAPASSRTIIEPYDLDFWQTSQDCSRTDTPPKSGKRYYYWLHISADLSFQMAYLMGYYDSIKAAPCIGPLVGWAGTLADEPQAPTELTASYDAEATGVALEWNAGKNAKAYNVYRGDSEDTGSMNMIAKDYGSLSGVDKSAEPGRDYYYAVKSVSDGTESSDFSPIAKGRRPLLPPTNAEASLVDSGTAAEVVWKAEPLASSYDIYVGLTSDFEDAAKIAESRTVCCYTNVLSGEFAVESHWYWVVSKNAYADSKPSEPAKLTVLPPTAVEVYASGANIAAGSITLSWRFPDGRELPKGMTFSVARKVNDGKSSVIELTSAESSMSYTDTTWGAAGKTATISYWVKPNADGWPMSEECETRKRYGVFVGIDQFQNDWCKRLRYCQKDGEKLCDMFWSYGECSGSRRLYNEEAKKADILEVLGHFGSGILRPGDIFLFSISSHGGVYVNTGNAYICCHDCKNGVGERLPGAELGNALKGFPTGVGVVAIVNICHADAIVPMASQTGTLQRLSLSAAAPCAVDSWADAFINDVNAAMSSSSFRMKTASATMRATGISIPKLTDGEIGWITAAGANESAYDGMFTSKCISEAGWEYGGADYNDDSHVTFGELSAFSRQWCLNVANIGRILHPGFRNDNVLSSIVAGWVPRGREFSRLTSPTVHSIHSEYGRLAMAWDSVAGAQEYAVMRYAEGSAVTTRVATVSNATSWSDGMTEALTPGVKYHYYVAAINPMDISECSEVASCVATEDPQLVSYANRTFAGGGPTAVASALNGDGSVNYSTVNLDHDGDGMTTFQEYVAGTNPLDTNSVFRATVGFENGVPVVCWEPDLNTNAVVRDYVVWGKTNLTDGAWHSPTNAGSRFFKVEVRLR